MMMRREFIVGATAVVAWPIAALGQKQAMPEVGFLSPTSPDTNSGYVRAFHQALKETGYVEGENVAIVYRWAEGHLDRMPDLAAELAHRPTAVIVTTAPPAAFAAKAATTTIPIVFSIVEDPVKLGLVASLARPGGNLTGVNFLNAELIAKRLALLLELVPSTTRLAVLVNPANAELTESTLREVAAGLRDTRLKVQIHNASTIDEIEATFATLARERPDALFFGPDPFFRDRRVQLALLSAYHRIPATYGLRDYSEAGGLMSYGASINDAFRQIGVYVGRILKGAKPADLPVVQASKFELVINAPTARMLGLTVPPTLLSTADEVIE
jgi:putative ABC transport system substrate-binding protein